LELKDDGPVVARRPNGFKLPPLDELAAELKTCIAQCDSAMEVTTVTYKK
jgi:hypothetical protein